MTPDQEALVLAHDVMARRYAGAFLRRARLPPYIERDDIIQAARLGLCDAARRWRPAIGPFEGYARIRIRGAIIDSLRNNRGVSSYSDVHDGKLRKRRQAHVAQLCTLDAPDGRPYDAPAPDVCELLERAILLDQIDAHLDDLDPREAFTIRAHCAGRTLKAIGAALGVVESRASQLYSSGAKRLRRHLAA